MVDGEKLGSVGFNYLGTPYSTMDCQKFVEQCLADCGLRIDLPGSNTWYRKVLNEGWIGTPEECVKMFGSVPVGAFLFILKDDGKEPAKYRNDGIGNASHIGICTGSLGKGAIHSSQTREMVAESDFHGKTIKNGGWNRVGLWTASVSYKEVLKFSRYEEEDSYTENQNGSEIDEAEPVEMTVILKRGKENDYADVAFAQAMLVQHGYDVGSYGIDGDFGKDTENAVKAFQKDKGLKVDGIIGPKTWEKLMDTSGLPVEPVVEDKDEEPDYEYYTVIIRHLDKNEANCLRCRYSNSEIEKENG